MAILCSPVSTQLDGGEGHREVQARSALCVAARCGRERSQGGTLHQVDRPIGEAARVGVPRAHGASRL